MIKTLHVKILLGLLCLGGISRCSPPKAETGAQTAAQEDKRPNIILIMADDLGFSDIGCYGSEIHTPNIDYLASNGVRFSNFYNTSRCCPTRAALLTGVYNHQAGIGEMTEDRSLPGYRGHLTDNVVTMAELLKDGGYRTGMVGKWHVSNTVVQDNPQAQLAWLNHQEEHPYFSPVEQYPTNRGFEKYFGNIWGVVDFFDPFSLVSGTTPVTSVPKDYYHTDAISDTAIAYIQEFSKSRKPFFLYVAETAPHWPLHALPEDIEKYQDTYKVGWDAIREKRYQKLVETGLIDPATTPLSPRIDSELSWEENPHKEWDARAMAVHAAMIDRMDQGIGRMIEALRQAGELDNTLIVFLSDNGASPEDAMRYGPGFDRPSKTRDGREIVYPVDKSVLPGPQTTFTSIGHRWANVSNTPYRYAKSQSYEGGILTPMVAYWPKGIKAKKGGVVAQQGHVMDFMATFAELANVTYPTTYNGKEIKTMQGISLVPALEGKQGEVHRALFNEHFGARYVRHQGWKLVARNNEEWNLYRINEDETELNDLAGQYPAKVQELEIMWQNWATSNHVLPKRKDAK
ncbi:arylsulfatase [Pontibacter sp. SGAir0037]|uniref:arylsulfatase n=1 Tax=Pontibacter sp. SGAir0037 TaxID=2571030 RepID=UPI0010CD1258|nr:arylsulfatase [Pontibacter sp. SGAir0037]QCR24649.1 arylsulfatase [Pontibacter sp. SGAir0037]